MKTLHIPFLMLCLLLLKTEAASAQNDTSYQLRVSDERSQRTWTFDPSQKVRIKMQDRSKYKGTFSLRDEELIIENKTIDVDSVKWINGWVIVDRDDKNFGVFVTTLGYITAGAVGLFSVAIANFSFDNPAAPVFFGILGTVPGYFIIRAGKAISGKRKFRTEKWEWRVIENLEQPPFDTKTKK